MIPVTPVPEPPEFNARVRQRGQQWLAANCESQKRLPDHWREFRDHLAEGFRWLCGYTAIWTLDGEVDHFVSIRDDRSQAYEWANYRYAAGWLNSSKGARKVLDPYKVGEGWFEILLPTLEMVATDKVPAEFRALAEQTLEALPIGRDPRILKRRGVLYDAYRNGEISPAELRRRAPLLAAAVEAEE